MDARILLGSIALVLSCSTTVSAQISPGPLSKAHQQLEGVTNCVTCHNFRAGARALKCLDCHAEIKRRINEHTGFHAHAYKPSPDQTDCARCHAEHNGQKFPLIRLERQTFNHAAETGFALEGKHRAQKCEACHNAQKIPAAARAEIKMKDPNQSFLGLKRECLTCHQDKHQGQLGPNCTRCHGQEDWKAVTAFNHSQTHFPLTGLHQQVACIKCHPAMQFKGVAFAGCQNCHVDPHRGAFQEAKFRGGCDSCHSTNGWKKPRLDAGFQHDQTQFKLVGKHADVACAACHKTTDFHKAVPHERCQQCHEDPHNGQFAKRPAGSDCAACHNEQGFKPTKFDRAAHAQSGFKLEGKHASLECAKCHQPAGRGAVYVSGLLTCAQCHNDPHAGEFLAAPWSNRCDACHTQESFRSPTFNVATHARSRFTLTGKHATVECGACHKPLPVPPAPMTAKAMLASIDAPGARRKYHFPTLTCSGCHNDPHQTKTACETCHQTENWKQTAPFDHAQTRFGLDGGHAKVACAGCHVPAGAEHAPRFAVAASTCGGCHQKTDAHAGQFQNAGRIEDCSACHTPAKWYIDAFNHDTTRFPLDRAHRNVVCEECHKQQIPTADKPIRLYRGTPVECVKCH